MIKKLLSIAAMAFLTLSASAETYELSVQPGWGASPALQNLELTGNTQWGEYILATDVSTADYKGGRLEYETTSSDWQFKIVGATEYYPMVYATQTSASLDFSAYTGPLKIELQAKTAGIKITVKSFTLIKSDGSEETVDIAPGGGWGITVGGLIQTPCMMSFSNQYGGVELYKADGSKCTWSPSSDVIQTYTVVLEEGAPFELLLEADDTAGKGVAYSYPNLKDGETSFTITLPTYDYDAGMDKPTVDISSVWLKAAVAPSNKLVRIKSITMVETKADQSAITEIEAADENAPVEYFNLQGVRVENPSNGLYIRRQGNKVTKVII